MEQNRRWYDNDPILKEALDLLKVQSEETKNLAAGFLVKMQEEVASNVIEHLYEIIAKYEGKGSRWYDSDPFMIQAIEFLRLAPPNIQRKAALKLLLALEEKNTNNTQDEI